MAMSNCSDSVVYAITRKHNSKRRAYGTYACKGRGPFFTRESGNLTQRDHRKYMGSAERSVGISKKKATGTQPMQFTVVMKKRGKYRKPRSQRVEAQLGYSSKAAVKKCVNAQTRYRLYRGDLAK